MTIQHDESPVVSDEKTTPSPGLIDNMIGLTYALREQLHDLLQLAVLETRQSISSVLMMAVIAIIMAILLVSAWLALIGAVIIVLISIGLAPAVAMLILSAANILLAAIGWVLIQRRGRSLGWPATLRTLKPRKSPDREGADP